MRGKKTVPPRFDRKGFFLGIGIGGVTLSLGLFLAWAILTAPEGASSSTGFTTAQRIARVLPHRVQEWLALGLSGLFVLFGIFSLILGMGEVVKSVAAKLRTPRD